MENILFQPNDIVCIGLAQDHVSYTDPNTGETRDISKTRFILPDRTTGKWYEIVVADGIIRPVEIAPIA